MFFGLTPALIISRIVTLLIAFSFHEFSHAFVANAFGDDTPRMNGRLTLNPIAHLDLMGSLMLLVAGFGWARPVPVNPYALGKRSSSALMWVSIAGPLSNLFLAIVAAIPLRFNLIPATPSSNVIPTAYDFMWQFLVINLALALFNLIPIAPLDGDKIADFFFPPPLARALETIRPYGPILLLALVFLPSIAGVDVFGWIMGPPIRNLLHLLVGV